MSRSRSQLSDAQTLRHFFHDELERTCREKQPDASEALRWYLTDLLSRFVRGEGFQERGNGRRGLRPLAMLYEEAMRAPTESQRRVCLQRLGDMALFVSGLFPGVFQRMAVGMDYYVAMGAGAYGSLSKSVGGEADLFGELSSGFVHWVEVLAAVTRRCPPFDAKAVLRLATLWQTTGNPDLARQLRRLGITLPPDTHPH